MRSDWPGLCNIFEVSFSPHLQIRLPASSSQNVSNVFLPMAAQRPAPSMALLRSLMQAPMTGHHQYKALTGLARRRAFHSSSRRFAEPKPSFRAQLYESTAQRVQRQRAIENFYAADAPRSILARLAAYAFGRCPSFPPSLPNL